MSKSHYRVIKASIRDAEPNEQIITLAGITYTQPGDKVVNTESDGNLVISADDFEQQEWIEGEFTPADLDNSSDNSGDQETATKPAAQKPRS